MKYTTPPLVNLFQNAVIGELMAQGFNWGERRHSPDFWGNILHEESGEVAKALVERDRAQVAHECVQVAACAFRLWRAMQAEQPEEWREVPWPSLPKEEGV